MATPPLSSDRDPLSALPEPPPLPTRARPDPAPAEAHAGLASDRPTDRSRPHPGQPATPGGAAAKAKPHDDRIAFVGLNDTADHEVRALRGRVIAIKNAPTLEASLADRAGIDTFVRSIRVPPDKAARIADAIEACDPAMRDMLAQLARTWAAGERGGRVPSRLVLSGHNASGGMFGVGDGTLRMADVTALAAAMPRAAAQVEDVHLAACYSGHARRLDELRHAFPKLRTFWGYAETAPGAHSGATAHLRRWASATRGTRADLDARIAEGTRKGDSVVTWSLKRGLSTNDSATAAEAMARVTTGNDVFVRAEAGEIDCPYPGFGPLRDHYDDVMNALGRPDLTTEQRAMLEEYAERAVRLLYYQKTVAPSFTAEYGDQLDRAWATLGGQERLAIGTRAELRATIRAFGERMAAEPERVTPEVREAWRRLTQLRDLSSDLIPRSWL